MENHKETSKYKANWDHRLKSDLDTSWKVWELQLEMDKIGNEDMNTEVNKRTSDPLGKIEENVATLFKDSLHNISHSV
jgi:hypothetical protein